MSKNMAESANDAATFGGEHDKAPAPDPGGKPHPQVAELEQLANDLNGPFDRDEVELGLPRRTAGSEVLIESFQKVGKTAASELFNLGQIASVWNASLQRVREGLENLDLELEKRIESVYPEPKLNILPAMTNREKTVGQLTENFADRLQMAMGGDSKTLAMREERCIKPPLGCGKPLHKTFDQAKRLRGTNFHDSASQREYHITGMCQACQDKFQADYEAAEEAAEEALERGCEGHPGLGDETEYCDGSCRVSGCSYGGHCKPGECAGPCGG